MEQILGVEERTLMVKNHDQQLHYLVRNVVLRISKHKVLVEKEIIEDDKSSLFLLFFLKKKLLLISEQCKYNTVDFFTCSF
jgi:hypothetical protein